MTDPSAPFRVREWLAELVNCRPDELVLSGKEPPWPAVIGRRETHRAVLYTRHGERAAAVYKHESREIGLVLAAELPELKGVVASDRLPIGTRVIWE